ncbi:MAG: hypothetical protein QXQ43_04085 [Nitrososphaerota archaeon]
MYRTGFYKISKDVRDINVTDTPALDVAAGLSIPLTVHAIKTYPIALRRFLNYLKENPHIKRHSPEYFYRMGEIAVDEVQKGINRPMAIGTLIGLGIYFMRRKLFKKKKNKLKELFGG